MERFSFAAEDDFKIAFGQLKKFSWRELQIATNNFSDEIGAGAFAKVYKGVLNDGTEIAVKRLLSTLTQDAGEASFLQEIEMISVAVHRNLLHLIGFCITPLERILVYPYMPNKSLASRLRGEFVSLSTLKPFLESITKRYNMLQQGKKANLV